MDITSFVLSITFFLGITLGLFLLFTKSGEQNNNKLLGVILLAILCYIIPSFFGSFGVLDQIPHIIGIRLVVNLAIGPLVYIYVKKCTQKGYMVTPKTGLYFIPYLISLIYSIPFLTSSGEYKFASYLSIVNTGDMGEPYWIPLLRCFINIVFFFLSLRAIILYKKHIINEASNIDVRYHQWLMFFSSSLWLPTIAITLFSFGKYNVFF